MCLRVISALSLGVPALMVSRAYYREVKYIVNGLCRKTI